MEEVSLRGDTIMRCMRWWKVGSLRGGRVLGIHDGEEV